MRINFPRITFNHFYSGSPELLEQELSRSSIRMKLFGNPGTTEDRQTYQNDLDKLTVLKYISQLRKGKVSREDFNAKVVLFDGQ